ncbi:MAG: 2-oxoacid:acceptor oxidoreductase family protein [Desulfuromonadales bacterium]
MQSQSYGPEARGGASKSEVIIADGPIDYPKATIVDACLAMTQEAADKYAVGIKPGGLLLLDDDFVQKNPEGDFKVLRLPIMRMAKEDIGREIVANVVALGAMIGLTGVVSKEAGEEAVLRKVPEAFKDLNRKAFNLGYEKSKELVN